MFKRVPFTEILQFLKAIDELLTAPVQLIVIGGCAVALAGHPARATSDVDVYGRLPPELEEAIRACQHLPGAVPISSVGVSSQPYDFEDRLQRVPESELANLEIFIPEAHDLAIMKMARGESHDIAALVEMHRHTPFAADTLLERYRDTDFIGNPQMIRLTLLLLVEDLFGPEKAAEFEALI